MMFCAKSTAFSPWNDEDLVRLSREGSRTATETLLSRYRPLVENKARELGLNELITLSTQAFTYFQSKGGFSEGTPDDLPQVRRDKYDQSGRNSKVLVKRLK